SGPTHSPGRKEELSQLPTANAPPAPAVSPRETDRFVRLPTRSAASPHFRAWSLNLILVCLSVTQIRRPAIQAGYPGHSAGYHYRSTPGPLRPPMPRQQVAAPLTHPPVLLLGRSRRPEAGRP